MHTKLELISDLTDYIANIHESLTDFEVDYCDIRIQLVDGDYRFHFGDSQFDSDHRGQWGYGTVHLEDTDFVALATEMVEECLEN